MTLLLLVGVTELSLNLFQENELERKRSSVVDKVATVRAKIEGEFNSTLFLSAGLMAHVATHPDIDEQEFTLIASEIVATGRNIKNIGLAKDNVITHIFPLAGNKAALGLEYKKLTLQWPAVARAVDLKSTVVAGPVDLVQGGRGFIVRTPIYTSSGVSGYLKRHKPSYWGLASIVIHADGFFQSAEFGVVVDGIEFAIRGKDGLGSNGGMIIGSEKLFELDPVISTINLPNGWIMANGRYAVGRMATRPY